MPKIKVNAWLDNNNTKFSNIPEICKCGTKLKKVDATKEGGFIMVYCPNLKCRYCEIFEV